MSVLKEHLKLLAEDGAALTREQASAVLNEILSGDVPEVETAALLAVLATRGEQAPELAGFVETMRARSTPVPLTDDERNELVDTCGTGGGGPLTFNISTGAALVAAAAGELRCRESVHEQYDSDECDGSGRAEGADPDTGGPERKRDQQLSPTYDAVRHTTIPALKVDQLIGTKQKISFYWSKTRTTAPFSPIYGNSEGSAFAHYANPRFVHRRPGRAVEL